MESIMCYEALYKRRVSYHTANCNYTNKSYFATEYEDTARRYCYTLLRPPNPYHNRSAALLIAMLKIIIVALIHYEDAIRLLRLLQVLYLACLPIFISRIIRVTRSLGRVITINFFQKLRIFKK